MCTLISWDDEPVIPTNSHSTILAELWLDSLSPCCTMADVKKVLPNHTISGYHYSLVYLDTMYGFKFRKRRGILGKGLSISLPVNNPFTM